MNSQNQRTLQVLKKIIASDSESEIQKLPGEILLRVFPEAASNPQSQLILIFAFDLLIRLHPVVTRVRLDVPIETPMLANLPKWNRGILLETLKEIYRSLKPFVEISVERESINENICCHITIGPCPALKVPGIWIGCDNWIAGLSAEGPLDIKPFLNPVGAFVAATLAVSEAWKKILLPLQPKIKHIKIQPLEKTMHFSAFDYNQNTLGNNPSLPEAKNIKTLTAIGLGAGGGATAFTLASCPGLQGRINLVDPDEIEIHNLNRYVFADKSDADLRTSKVQCVSRLFHSNSKVQIKTWHAPFLGIKKELAMEDFQWVLALADNRETRRAIQFETPQIIWDGAASEEGEFRIWRMVLGKTECMHCKHPAGEKDPEQEMAKQLSEHFGLNPENWFQKMTNNEMFSGDELRVINSRFEGQHISYRLPKEGQRCADWFADQCGKLKLSELKEEIPIPFAPVMAGVLLAGEIIKEHLFPDHVLNGYYWNSLIALFNPNFQPQQRRPKKNCRFCSDQIYHDQYKRRWGKPIESEERVK